MTTGEKIAEKQYPGDNDNEIRNQIKHGLAKLIDDELVANAQRAAEQMRENWMLQADILNEEVKAIILNPQPAAHLSRIDPNDDLKRRARA